MEVAFPAQIAERLTDLARQSERTCEEVVVAAVYLLLATDLRQELDSVVENMRRWDECLNVALRTIEQAQAAYLQAREDYKNYRAGQAAFRAGMSEKN